MKKVHLFYLFVVAICGASYGSSSGAELYNIALGSDALSSNTTGRYNVAIGNGTLQSSTMANYSVAIGFEALNAYIAEGTEENTAIGFIALKRLTTGSNNTSVGSDSMPFTTIGSLNTAIGQFAGFSNTTGSRNTFIGNGTTGNTTGNNNTYLGYRAGANDDDNAGGQNTYLGAESGPISGQLALSNATAIGYGAKAGISNSMILGPAIGAEGGGTPPYIGIGTMTPTTTMELFAIQRMLHSTPFTARGIIAVNDASGNDLGNGNPAIPVANSGGGISFGAYVNGTTIGSLAAIKAGKLNSISGDGTGYLDIYVADSAGVMESKIRVHDSGNIELKKAGAGIIMTNRAGNIRKLVRLNDAGNGFIIDNQ